MGEIIQFPEKRSNGYYNLTALFEICDSVASCNAYLDIAETLFGMVTFQKMNFTPCAVSAEASVLNLPPHRKGKH